MTRKLPIVHCRICGGDIDRNADPDGNEWFMASRNYYYHKECYKNWKNSTPADDKEYERFIYDFISRDLKVSYDYFMCEAQRKKFLKNHMTNKGIFFALKYFYDVKHGDWSKGSGGIGIVPFIYSESCAYWISQEQKNSGIVAKIEQQMKERQIRKTKVIRHKEDKPRFEPIDLDIVTETEDN